MFYNVVENKKTPFPFRFKTRDEFIKQYGPNWQSIIRFTWNDVGHMDFLFGKNLENIDLKYTKDLNYELYISNHKWNISYDMLTENIKQNFNHIYNNNNNKLIYE